MPSQVTFTGFGPHGHYFSAAKEELNCWHCQHSVTTRIHHQFGSLKDLAIGTLLASGDFRRKKPFTTHTCPECKTLLGFHDPRGLYKTKHVHYIMPGYYSWQQECPPYTP